MNRKEKYSYDLDRYCFRHEIEKIFETSKLEKIHDIEKCDFNILNIETDQTTKFHKKFYGFFCIGLSFLDSFLFFLLVCFLFSFFQPMHTRTTQICARGMSND